MKRMAKTALTAKDHSFEEVQMSSVRTSGQTSQLTSVARWSAAAAAGLSLMGCPESTPDKSEKSTENSHAVVAAPGAKDKNCCMGLNDCKGKGGCAVPESNACAGKNDCKGKGGCNMHCPK